MKFIFGLLFIALFSIPAHAQSPVTQYCYSFKTNQGGPGLGPCPGNLPTTNYSATIGTGGTFQSILAAATNAAPRNSLTIENNNASDACYIFIGAGSATEGTSILLNAGGSYFRAFPYVPFDEIQGTCASGSDTIYIDTQ